MAVIIKDCKFKNCGIAINDNPDEFETCEVDGVVFSFENGYYLGKCKKCKKKFKLKTLDGFKCC